MTMLVKMDGKGKEDIAGGFAMDEKKEKRGSSSASKTTDKSKRKKSIKRKNSKDRDPERDSSRSSKDAKQEDSTTTIETVEMSNESELSGAVRKSRSRRSKDSKDKKLGKPKRDKEKKSKKKGTSKDKNKSMKDDDDKKSKKLDDVGEETSNKDRVECKGKGKDKTRKRNKEGEKEMERTNGKDDKKKNAPDAKHCNEEDEQVKNILETFVRETGKNGNDDATESSTGVTSEMEDEQQDVSRVLNVEDNIFDHVVMAAPEIEAAIAEFKQKTGISPVISSNVKGLGIKTARASFGGTSFIEIIAPDPEKKGPIGDILLGAGLTGLEPFHWAIRLNKMDDLTREAETLGYIADCIGMSAARGDGTRWNWEALYLYGHKLQGLCPFFVDWDVKDHPCQTMPIVGDLLEVKIAAPDGDPVHKLQAYCKATGFTLESGIPNFEIKFDSPKGKISFSTSEMLGFKLPGIVEGPNVSKKVSSEVSQIQGTLEAGDPVAEPKPIDMPKKDHTSDKDKRLNRNKTLPKNQPRMVEKATTQKDQNAPTGAHAKPKFIPIPHTVPTDDHDEDDSMYETVVPS